MTLYIDPTGGIAGDMIVSALVSLGADKSVVLESVKAAIDILGTGKAEFITLAEGETRLKLEAEAAHSHLGSIKGRVLLDSLFNRLNIKNEYSSFGFKAFDILSHSEMKAHKLFNIDMGHNHGEDQAWLHEAQDIIIDITGTVAALQSLGIRPSAALTAPVSVGGGTVTCSHGVLNVPPPAVEVILGDYSIKWAKGPVEKELCTPTGAALMAALINDNSEIVKIEENTIKKTGSSRGSGDFPVPPLKFHLI